MARAEYGEVGVSPFVAGTAFRESLGDNRSANCCIFHTKCVDEVGQVSEAACEMTISCSGHGRIVFLLADAIQAFPAAILNSELHGRHSISRCCRVTLVAPRVVLDVSCETKLNHPSHFSWQVAGAIFGELGG